MVVIYAEKASLAKALAQVLKAGQRIPLENEPTVGHWECSFKGEACIICHGAGHLAELAEAKEYGEQYAKWDLNAYPCIPDEFIIKPKSRTFSCYKYVKSFFDKADWLINATDADREGELIFGYVYQLTGCNKPWKRLWITDMTDEKLLYAFDNLKDSSEMLSLQNAGRARSISDWLYGINLTIAATKKFGGDQLLSVGRVQTSTLALVVEREKSIKNHVKTPYWKLTANFTSGEKKFEAEYSDGNFSNESKAVETLNKCMNKKGTVTEKTVKLKSISAPLLYNSTQLQVSASKNFGWSADKTMSVMQSLYEHKYMSYPRTSTEHLTEAMKDEVKATLIKIMKLPEYSAFFLSEGEWNSFSKRHFDDSKVGSHTAIIPTSYVPDSLNNLSDEERQLYDLLVRSLLQIVYPKAEEEETALTLDVNGVIFKAKGTAIKNNGWYTVSGIPEKKGILPDGIQEKDEYSGEYIIKRGETEPPKHYTEADLLSAMELAGKNLEDEEAQTLMKMKKMGLGTDATRAGIVTGLFKKELLAKKGKSVIPTELGIFLIDTLPVNEMKSAETTGQLEMMLNDVELGKTDYNDYIDAVKNNARSFYDQIVKSEAVSYISESEKSMLCPLCNKPVHHFKWGYGCSGYKDGCKFSVNNEICGKKITEAQITMLIKSGKTGIIKEFKGKSGSFDAVLKIDRTQNKIIFEFPTNNKKKG